MILLLSTANKFYFELLYLFTFYPWIIIKINWTIFEL